MRDRTDPMTPFQERLGRFTIQTLSGLNDLSYRLTAGRIGGTTPTGSPICLLTTIGRRSGRPRTAALVCVVDGDDLVVAASLGGMSRHPYWYLNLVAEPRAIVQLGAERRTVLARDATPDERARFWPPFIASYAHFAAYQVRTEREIPLVVLSPVTTPPREPR